MSEEIPKLGSGERGLFYYDITKRTLVRQLKHKAPEVNAPFVIGDEMEAVESMIDGTTYTSKSKIRAHYRANNVIERGNEGPQAKTPALPTFEEIKDDAEKAYYDLKYDRVPIDEQSKALNLEEERTWKEHQKRMR